MESLLRFVAQWLAFGTHSLLDHGLYGQEDI